LCVPARGVYGAMGATTRRRMTRMVRRRYPELEIRHTRARELNAMLRAAATSSCVMACGDVLCQGMQAYDRRRSGAQATTGARDGEQGGASASALRSVLGFEPDLTRTARFFAVGALLHGPFFHFAFKRVDALVGVGTDAATVIKKTAISHATLFPSYTCAFFFAMNALEGEPVAVGANKLYDKAYDTFVSGSCFWPVANAINFGYVPRPRRILFLNACGVGWNAYMSHVVSTGDARGVNVGPPEHMLAASKRE